MTPRGGLFLSALAFVGMHFLLSHPLRRPLVERIGQGPLRGLYSPVALVGGTVLFLAATWLHPFPVGLWRWIWNPSP